MKYKLEIKSYLGDVLFTAERDDREPTVKEAIEEAVRNKANLYWANFSRANLSGAYLSRANLSVAYLSGANLSGANLSGANLSGANLSRANLSGANLSRAYLSRANLSGANLYWANLSVACLSGANLSGAAGLNKYLTTDLYILSDQPGKIRAYKLINEKLEGTYNGGIKYEVGRSYEVTSANTNEQKECGAGINLATLPWILREWKEGYRILIAEFTAKDIAAIPIGSDGKFRVYRCKIVGEKDLKELDWPPKMEGT